MRNDFKLVDQTSKSLSLRKTYKRENNSEGIKPLDDIPMPKPATFKIANLGPPSEIDKCKLTDYKKYYGGKFHRLDRSSKTIDVMNN